MNNLTESEERKEGDEEKDIGLLIYKVMFLEEKEGVKAV